jgi:small subunit ribosomal protein S6
MKIAVDQQTRIYELTFLLPANSTESELKAEIEKVSQLITKYQGEILKTDNWGKRELAYKIKHQGKQHQEAVYTHQIVKFVPEKAPAFERELFLEETLMRHLLVVSENQDEALATADIPAEQKENV